MPDAAPPLFPVLPEDFDEFVEWLDRFGRALVLLDERPLPEVGAVVADAAARVRDHIRTFDRVLLGPAEGAIARGESSRLIADHRWFETSLEQLDWCYGIVAREDHGGHRQALGQYARLLAEALRRHRARERARSTRDRTAPTAVGPGVGKP
ncbi:MAG TPA: hypothetical protein VEL82_00850 [Thermoplasmata archaeon]|nr:hypothetical protein [Thermoplasmata archaeon]